MRKIYPERGDEKMFEPYIAKRETAENIVAAVLKKGACEAFYTLEELAVFQSAWEQLSAEQQEILRIMCDTSRNKMQRVRKAEQILHVTQSMPYKMKKTALDRLGKLLFE